MTPLLRDTDRADPVFSERYPGKIGGKMPGKMLFFAVFLLSGGIALLLRPTSAAAQIILTPTPIPQVVATQAAANAAQNQVNDLQAQRAQTEAQLSEINRNIENQIAAATQAAADARNAAATQNAVEFGAAIGRLEGALDQLRESYAGKDAIISDMSARIDLQAAQHITDTNEINKLTSDLQQAQDARKNAVNAYNALTTQQKTNQQNDMVNNAISLIVALAFLLAMIALAAFVLQRRRSVVIEPPPAPPIDAEYTVSEDETNERNE